MSAGDRTSNTINVHVDVIDRVFTNIMTQSGGLLKGLKSSDDSRHAVE